MVEYQVAYDVVVRAQREARLVAALKDESNGVRWYWFRRLIDKIKGE